MNLLQTQDGSQVSFSNRDQAGSLSPALTGTPGYATDGNPNVPQPSTQIPAYHYDEMMIELVNLQLAANITASDSVNTQIYQAILALSRVVDTGSVNAYAAAPANALLTGLPALSAMPDGFTVDLLVGNTNSSTTPTFAWNAGSALTITDEAGNALIAGDMIGGRYSKLTKAGGASPTWLLRNPRGARMSDNYYGSHGTYSLTVPSWAAHADIDVAGAGGGASGGLGGAGGGGGVARSRGVSVTPGATMTVVVGQGGAGASSAAAAGNGGSSSASGGGLGSAISATGGAGAAAGPGNGGVGSGGTQNLTGQCGIDIDGSAWPSVGYAPGGSCPMGGAAGSINQGGSVGVPTGPGGGGSAQYAVALGQSGADGGVRVVFYP